MADEYTQTGVCSGNWWEPSRNRFETGSSPSPSSSSMTHLNTMATFGPHDDSAAAAVLADPNLQLMGLGLSSQSMDWNNNQALLRGGTMLQEEINRPGGLSFSLDHASHHQFDSHSSSGDSTVMDSPYANNNNNHSHNPGNMLQGLLGSDPHQAATARYYHPYAENYGINTSSDQVLSNSWISPLNNKFPQQFLRTTSPPNSHQFSNNAPYWLATASGPATARPGFFQPSSPQMHVPTAASFDEKPKIATEKVQESSTAGGKKSGSEPGIKRSRNEPPASLPAFKVRKEKMGDRITALQQLVSPFGKTDTASVLTEAIEYIKFLHQQVNVLSTPYMNSTGAHLIQHQQASSDKSRDPEGPNLRSRGLCLVPISSTFPVTHETTVDFWTPTVGGTFR